MKSFKYFALLFLGAIGGRADVLSLQPSTQQVTFTGLGTNASGAGTTRISFGSCTFDGSNTACTVSGRYTGLGGGTYTFLLTYPGSGLSPLQTVASPPGSDLVFFNLSAGSLTFSITPDSGPTVSFQDLNFSIFFNSATDSCTGVSTCSVGSVGITRDATIRGPVNGQFDPTPVIKTLVTATGYGGSPSIAPATWIEVYGQNLSTTLRQLWGGADFAGAQAPVKLGGTTATVGGKAAFVEFVSPGQVNLQVPSGLAAGQLPVIVTTAGGASAATTVTVNSVQPGILAPPAFKIGSVQYAVAVFPDNITYALPPGAISGVPTRRAKAGDVLTLYGVGFGTVSPNIDAGLIVGQSNTLPGFQASIGGQAATVQFAGLVSGFLGLYQFNIVVPSGAAGGDAAPFTFSIAGATGSQTLFLPVQN